MAQRPVLQFKVILQQTDPLVWRRIQISDLCSFWDLHVAIQDGMGWEDCHLHHFEVINPQTNQKEYMGIPADADDFDTLNTLPGWEFLVKDYLSDNQRMLYVYDYGDDWSHVVEFEGIFPKTKPAKEYPICLDGEMACPPEDVGGGHGYQHFLEAINDPKHEEHHDYLQWVCGSFDSDKFDPTKVKFSNPKKRLARIQE